VGVTLILTQSDMFFVCQEAIIIKYFILAKVIQKEKKKKTLLY